MKICEAAFFKQILLNLIHFSKKLRLAPHFLIYTFVIVNDNFCISKFPELGPPLGWKIAPPPRGKLRSSPSPEKIFIITSMLWLYRQTSAGYFWLHRVSLVLNISNTHPVRGREVVDGVIILGRSSFMTYVALLVSCSVVSMMMWWCMLTTTATAAELMNLHLWKYCGHDTM